MTAPAPMTDIRKAQLRKQYEMLHSVLVNLGPESCDIEVFKNLVTMLGEANTEIARQDVRIQLLDEQLKAKEEIATYAKKCMDEIYVNLKKANTNLEFEPKVIGPGPSGRYPHQRSKRCGNCGSYPCGKAPRGHRGACPEWKPMPTDGKHIDLCRICGLPKGPNGLCICEKADKKC